MLIGSFSGYQVEFRSCFVVHFKRDDDSLNVPTVHCLPEVRFFLQGKSREEVNKKSRYKR